MRTGRGEWVNIFSFVRMYYMDDHTSDMFEWPHVTATCLSGLT